MKVWAIPINLLPIARYGMIQRADLTSSEDALYDVANAYPGRNDASLRRYIMKQSVSPVTLILVVIATIAVIAGIFVIVTNGTQATQKANTGPGGMPPDVAAEFSKRMGGANATGPQAGGGAGAPTKK
jgi:hypothetical protein